MAEQMDVDQRRFVGRRGVPDAASGRNSASDLGILYGRAEYSSDTPWVQVIAFDFKAKRGVYADISGENDAIRVHRVDGIGQEVEGTAPFDDAFYWMSPDLSWSSIGDGIDLDA